LEGDVEVLQAVRRDVDIGAVAAPRRLALPPYSGIWVATILLFAISPLLAPASVHGSALLSMLPFAAILALASIGQLLVVQQRGLDLSVPGMISLATVVVTQHADGSDARVPVAILLAMAVCAAAGLASGVAVTTFGITPLVATLGVNALLLGVILQITAGSDPPAAPPGLSSFALGKTAGVPHLVIVAAIAVAVAATIVRSSVIGRRFVAVGASAPAARAAGIGVRRYQIATYVVAGMAYAGAGALLAGFLNTPGLSTGESYLLPTIAAVVLGGTSLIGGAGSVVATAGGALFLTQLQSVVLGMGAPASAQLIIQGVIIALGMGLRTVPWERLRRRVRPGLGGSLPAAPPRSTRRLSRSAER
jgi:ribose transport system permease protein